MYHPIKCPNCGSGQIIPSEAGRVYCKSCDQFFEKVDSPEPTVVREEPAEAIKEVYRKTEPMDQDALALFFIGGTILICVLGLVFMIS